LNLKSPDDVGAFLCALKIDIHLLGLSKFYSSNFKMQPFSMYVSCQQILDALPSQIAVVDSCGCILYVNQAWHDFAVQNGLPADYQWEGTNYLATCRIGGSTEGIQAAELIDAIAHGQQKEGYLEYPCHSQTTRRWFMMHVAVMPDVECCVISHHNITDRKLMEEKIEQLSLHDPLTGLGNRRLLVSEYHRQWLHHQRHQTCMSILMVDIDHFKHYNDQFGHLAGDECLKAIAEVIQQHAQRSDDVAIRFGGEEFLLLLGQTNAAAALELGRRIQQAIMELPLRMPNNAPMTVSIGIASACPQADYEPESLVNLADQQLYIAKQSGRNCCKLHVIVN
jgi:diguanylate cyclase (GGDEF)-like protein